MSIEKTFIQSIVQSLVFENIPSFEFLFKGQKVIEFFGCERTVGENSAKTEALKVGNIPLYNSTVKLVYNEPVGAAKSVRYNRDSL